MTLFDYHRLQREEAAGWDAARMEAAVRAQDAGFPERLAAVLPSGDYKTRVSENLRLFQQIQELCEVWLAATPEQRAFIRSKIDKKRAYMLGGFRAEAKRLALETNSESWVRLGLASIAIDDLNCGDARDVILSVQGLLVTARKIHADWGALVRSVAALAGPGITALLEDCLRNHPA